MERGRIDNGRGNEIAWQRLPGRSPGVVFFPGFRSDIKGDKAQSLARFCAERGQALLLFDYSGHGESGGAFVEGTIGRWTADALTTIDALATWPLVLVGSSMGGWIALLAALARPGQVAGLIGVAAAPDFTEELIWAALLPGEQDELVAKGLILLPSQCGEPTLITLGLIEDGRDHLVMHSSIPLTCPVRLLHGQADADVPWEVAIRLAERLESADVQVTLVKGADHRMSSPSDLSLLHATLIDFLGP